MNDEARKHAGRRPTNTPAEPNTPILTSYLYGRRNLQVASTAGGRPVLLKVFAKHLKHCGLWTVVWSLHCFLQLASGLKNENIETCSSLQVNLSIGYRVLRFS